MKKFVSCLLAATSVLAMSCAFTACAIERGEDNQKTSYFISTSTSDIYTLNGLPEKAQEGEEIKFTVTIHYPLDTLLNSVQTYATTTNYTNLTADADGVYSFTMPNESVSILVDAAYYPDNQTDNFLTWAEDNSTTIEKWVATSEEDTYYNFYDATLEANVSSTPSQCGGYFTNHTENVLVFDQSVIPSDAITITTTKSNSSNSATAFTISIDRSKVNVGTTKLVLVVSNGHKFGDKATLVHTITVR